MRSHVHFHTAWGICAFLLIVLTGSIAATGDAAEEPNAAPPQEAEEAPRLLGETRVKVDAEAPALLIEVNGQEHLKLSQNPQGQVVMELLNNGRNMFFGELSGHHSTPEPQFNVCIGDFTGIYNAEGKLNTFLGFGAGSYSTAGRNTCLGALSGTKLGTGEGNTLAGCSAGAHLTAGDDNTLVGNGTAGVLPNKVLDDIGPAPRIAVDRVTFRPADGGDLPTFANSIYYDFAVWQQGYNYGRGGVRRFHCDNALLGIIGGKGMPNVIPGLGSDHAAWDAKRGAERMWLDWGYGNFEFYTIWSFYGQPALWAKLVDVDGDPQTQSRFHGQTVFPYILTKHGYDGDTWASNYYAAMKAARDLVQKYDPDDGRVEEQNHWSSMIAPCCWTRPCGEASPWAT